MDGTLAGALDVFGAIEAQDQLRSALTSTGFLMRKSKILHRFKSDHLLREDVLEFKNNSYIYISKLWAKSDQFFFTMVIEIKDNFTKSEVF